MQFVRETKLIHVFLIIVWFGSYNCENITYPCERNVEPDCIRAYLSHKSGCKPIKNGPNFDPNHVPLLYLEIPAFNGSEKKTNSKFLGFRNSKPVDLKVDHDAHYTTLTISHPNITQTGTITLFFYSHGNAPAVFTTEFNITYINSITTTIIPGSELIDLNESRTFFTFEGVPVVELGANVAVEVARNEVIRRSVTAILANIRLVAIEESVVIGSAIGRGFIDQNLCHYLH